MGGEEGSVKTVPKVLTADRPPADHVNYSGILHGGLGLLFTMHLFHRTNNVLLAYFSITAATLFDMTLLVLGQYLLPVLLFLHITRCRGTESRTGAAKAC